MIAYAKSVSRLQPAWTLAVTLIGSVGCSTMTDAPPAAPVVMSLGAVESDSSFYFYFDRRTPLRATDDVFIIQSRDRDARLLVDQALTARGIAARAVTTVASGGHMRVAVSSGNVSARDAVLADLRGDGRFSFAEPAYRTVNGNGLFEPINRLSIRFRSSVSADASVQFLTERDLRIIRPPSPDSGRFEYVVEYRKDSQVRPLAQAAEVSRSSMVDWASPALVGHFQLHYTPSDPYYSWQYHLQNTATVGGVPVDINPRYAWNLTQGGGLRVGIVDDGVDWNQPDLFQAFGGSQAYDLMGDEIPPGGTDSPMNPFCNDTHGTAVAGTMMAAHNTVGVSGVAPNSTLRIVRAFRTTYQCAVGDQRQSAHTEEIAAGINWLWSSGQADVINNSWGSPDDWPETADITTAINNATTLGRGGRGTVVVFSSGNSGNAMEWPATLSNVVTVGAITRVGAFATYTETGPSMDLVAPSSPLVASSRGDLCSPNYYDFVTDDRVGSPGCSNGPNNDVDYTMTFGGTSAAAPQVTGAVTLLLSREPTLTAAQVRDRLCATADPWPGAAEQIGCGKLNVFRALVPTPLSVSLLNQPSSVRPGATCTFTASVSGGVPPYTYAWFKNGAPTAYNAPSVPITAPSQPPFTVRVDVTDASGVPSVSKSKSVTVSPSAPQCGPV